MRPPLGALSMRLQLHGCVNRPFYHIVVMKKKLERDDPIIEQIGTYDPMPNIHNEKLVSFNFERLRYWMGYSSMKVTVPVKELLGLCGFLPIPPSTFKTAWEARRAEKAGLESESKNESNTNVGKSTS